LGGRNYDPISICEGRGCWDVINLTFTRLKLSIFGFVETIVYCDLRGRNPISLRLSLSLYFFGECSYLLLRLSIHLYFRPRDWIQLLSARLITPLWSHSVLLGTLWSETNLTCIKLILFILWLPCNLF